MKIIPWYKKETPKSKNIEFKSNNDSLESLSPENHQLFKIVTKRKSTLTGNQYTGPWKGSFWFGKAHGEGEKRLPNGMIEKGLFQNGKLWQGTRIDSQQKTHFLPIILQAKIPWTKQIYCQKEETLENGEIISRKFFRNKYSIEYSFSKGKITNITKKIGLAIDNESQTWTIQEEKGTAIDNNFAWIGPYETKTYPSNTPLSNSLFISNFGS